MLVLPYWRNKDSFLHLCDFVLLINLLHINSIIICRSLSARNDGNVNLH